MVGLGFRVLGLGFWLWGLGFGVWGGLGFRGWGFFVLGLGLGLGFRSFTKSTCPRPTVVAILAHQGCGGCSGVMNRASG